MSMNHLQAAPLQGAFPAALAAGLPRFRPYRPCVIWGASDYGAVLFRQMHPLSLLRPGGGMPLRERAAHTDCIRVYAAMPLYCVSL